MKIHDGEHIERGDADAPDERNLEQQVERNGRADDFSEVAGANGNFAKQPQRDGDPPGIMITAGLRQVAASHDAELGAERLQNDCHEVREQNDAQQRVAKLRAASEVGGPIAGIHVADRDEIAGARKGQELAPKAQLFWHLNGAMNFRQTGRSPAGPPCLIGLAGQRGGFRCVHVINLKSPGEPDKWVEVLCAARESDVDAAVEPHIARHLIGEPQIECGDPWRRAFLTCDAHEFNIAA